MNELIEQLKSQVGLDPAVADKVGAALGNNASEVPTALAGGESALVAFLGKLGISSDVAAKVASFLTQHAADVPKWLGSGAAQGLLQKGLGGLFGKS